MAIEPLLLPRMERGGDLKVALKAGPPRRPSRKEGGRDLAEQSSHERARGRRSKIQARARPIAIFVRSSLSRCAGFDFFSFVKTALRPMEMVGGDELEPEEQTVTCRVHFASPFLRLVVVLGGFSSILSYTQKCRYGIPRRSIRFRGLFRAQTLFRLFRRSLTNETPRFLH